MELVNHKVLITGGSSGIGFEMAAEFVRRGNAVTICGRNQERLDEALQTLGSVKAVQCDLEEPEAAGRLIEQAVELMGGLTILVNNAAVQFALPFHEASPSELAEMSRREIQINLHSLVSLVSHSIPHLRQQTSAAIVNVSSALAITPKQSAPIYCATKAAVHSFCKSLRYQMEDNLPHIKVFEVMPPLVETPMTAGRGGKKITPQQVVSEMFQGIESDTAEIRVAKAKLVALLHRLIPSMAAKLLRNG